MKARLLNIGSSKLSNDLISLHKQVDRYTQRLNKTKNQIRDLETELISITPRKRARSELSKSSRKADELVKLSNKIIETNIILNSYENLMKKYFQKVQNSVAQKKKSVKNLNEMKPLILKRPSRQQSRQPSRLTSSRPNSSLRQKQHLPSIPPVFDQSKLSEKTEAVFRIIKRFFKTTDPQTIKNLLDNQRDKKRYLQMKQNEAEMQLQALQMKKSKYETLIHNFSPIKVRDMLLITEGKSALNILQAEKCDQTEILRDFQAQKNSFLISSPHLTYTFDLPEANDLTDLSRSYRQIAKIIKASNLRSRGKVSFTIPDLILPDRNNEDFEAGNDSANIGESVSIPRISLASAIGNSIDFFPGTRSTRRAFNAFNSNSDFRESLSSRGSSDIAFFGKALGSVLVDRFCLAISGDKQPLSIVENRFEASSLSPIFVNKVNSFTPREVVKTIAEQYTKNADYLHLSVLSDWEAAKSDKGFSQFAASRDFLLGKFVENFDEDLLNAAIENLIANSNDVVTTWMIRDIVLKDAIEDVSPFFDTFIQPFKKRLLALPSISDILGTIPFIGYFACFSTFLARNRSQAFHEYVMSFLDVNLSKIMSVFFKEINSPIARCGLVSLFQLGKFCPQYFFSCIEFQNKAVSDFLAFLRSNISSPTCVRDSLAFFSVAFPLLSKESILFHTAMVFHYAVMQLFSTSGINLDILSSLLSCLITVVANRNKSINDQLVGLGFLQFLMKNFELEAFVENNKIPSDPAKKPLISTKVNFGTIQENKINKLNRMNKAAADCDEEEPKDSNVSYLNIPKMKLPQLNLENPKLQLHFKPYSSINRNSMRSSITRTQYLEERKKYPIYLSKEIHIVYVQLIFALLIDHKTHRLDTFFCDPFPSVNRKPNVLFILMLHMEGKLNQDIVDSLKKIFENTEDLPKLDSVNSFSSIEPKDANKSKIEIVNRAQKFMDYMRLLRLTVPSCFSPKKYSNGYHIASGAFGAVMGVTCDGNDLAVKILEKSRNECDNPHLIEVYTEVSILEICKGDRRVTQLFDYGCSSDSYYIVMENYPTTLKAWRKSFKNPQSPSPSEASEKTFSDTASNENLISNNQYNIKFNDIQNAESDENDKSNEETKRDENNKNNEENKIDENNKSNEETKRDENNKNNEENKIDENDESRENAERDENNISNKEDKIDENDKSNENVERDENDKTSNEDDKIDESHKSVENSGRCENNKSDEDLEINEDVFIVKNEEDNELSKVSDSVKSEESSKQNESDPKSSQDSFSRSGEWDAKASPPLDTLLRVYREFLNCATVLKDHRINHFDIKCDNVMLDASGRPTLGDFGESMLYDSESTCYTLLNRGTEWIKSPEMLSIALDSSAKSPNFDRLRKVGAGPASDIWSIGCLFFELITGEYLFIDSDWSRFFMRVTNPNEEILTPEKLKMLPDDPRFKAFIEFVLQRNVRRRPNLNQVIVKFDEMFPNASLAPLPVIEKRKPQTQPPSPASLTGDSNYSFSEKLNQS